MRFSDPDRYVRCHAMEIIICYLAGVIVHENLKSTLPEYSKVHVKKAMDIAVRETSLTVVDDFVESVARESTRLASKERRKCTLISTGTFVVFAPTENAH